jgi:hypothetical protein
LYLVCQLLAALAVTMLISSMMVMTAISSSRMTLKQSKR